MSDSRTQPQLEAPESYALTNEALTRRLITLYTEGADFREHFAEIARILNEQNRQLKSLRLDHDRNTHHLKAEVKRLSEELKTVNSRCTVLESGFRIPLESTQVAKPVYSLPSNNVSENPFAEQ